MLSFTAFSVFDPNSSRLDGLISEDDRNCAVSRPNALLGSRSGGEHGTKSAFEVTEAHYNGTSFDLLELTIKPMTAPLGDEQITIWVQGCSHRGGPESRAGSTPEETLLWHVDFPVGYHHNFVATMPETWSRLSRVEMWAQYGPDQLDWEFCVDGVKLLFRKDLVDRNLRLELRHS